MDEVLWTQSYLLYHFVFWLIRPPVPRVTALPGFRLRLHCRLSFKMQLHRKTATWCFTPAVCVSKNQPATRPAPLHGGVCRPEKSLRGFFGDRRFAAQISATLSRPPWLDIAWQGKNTFPELAPKNPSVDFSGIADSRGKSARC